MKTIAVTIQKGGSSKTLTCQVLAEMLAKDQNQKVLCIDTDPQCNLTSVSGVSVLNTQNNNLYSLLKSEKKLEECIVNTTYYDLIPGSMLLSSADSEFVSLGREQLISEILEKIENDYDFCIIDTPPALGIMNIMSLTAANLVLIPTECSVLAMIGLKQLNKTISVIRQYSNPDLKISGILVTRYNGRANINQSIYDSLQEISKEMGTKVFDTKIRETVKVKEAQSQFVPILDYANNCSAVQDYRQFLTESDIL